MLYLAGSSFLPIRNAKSVMLEIVCFEWLWRSRNELSWIWLCRDEAANHKMEKNANLLASLASDHEYARKRKPNLYVLCGLFHLLLCYLSTSLTDLHLVLLSLRYVCISNKLNNYISAQIFQLRGGINPPIHANRIPVSSFDPDPHQRNIGLAGRDGWSVAIQEMQNISLTYWNKPENGRTWIWSREMASGLVVMFFDSLIDFSSCCKRSSLQSRSV